MKRPEKPTEPVALLFYLREATDEDRAVNIMTPEEFEEMRGYEPNKEFAGYETYVERCRERIRQLAEIDLVLAKVPTTRETFEDTIRETEASVGFNRWVVS